LFVIPAKAGIQSNTLCAALKTYIERFARCIETGLTSFAVVKRFGLRRNDEQKASPLRHQLSF
jgi:hypothetical protein